MTKKLYLPLLLAVLAVALASCSKKMDYLSAEHFTVNPHILEAVGGKVPVTINGRFPAKYFKKNAVVEVTPVLRWRTGEARAQTTTFQGERVQGNNRTISYRTGGNYTIKTEFNYRPEMMRSELYLDFKVRIGSKSYNVPSVKVADGVLSTAALVSETLKSANPALGEDAFQRIIKEKHDANIMFLIQQANIRTGELKTAKDFNKEVQNVDQAVNKRISNIEVSAYASPDGGLGLNTKLAESREQNTAQLINSELRKAKIDAAVDARYTAQDWEGFQELVSKSNIQDKDLILRVLSMYEDPAQREQEIKNISSVYKNLADEILPQLRRSRLTLNYEIIGKSDEEIARLATENPVALNVEELLYAATLTTERTKKAAIYNQAIRLFPNDFRGYNNLALLAYQDGRIDEAQVYLKQAAAQKDAPEVNMNMGLIALLKGDTEAAEASLGRAAGVKQLGETLGNLYIAQGQYEKAVNAFGETKTNSAALAQLLAKDYNKAKQTLAEVESPDAYTDYLMAILGARTNNLSMLTQSMHSAVSKEPALAKKALSDLEFAKYFTNSSFMNLLR